MGTIFSVDLYLIRHGLTKWNLEKRYLGHTDQELDLEKLVELEPLRRTFEEITPHFIFTSDLQRCVNTSHYLFPEKKGCFDPRLREIHFGDWDGQTHQQLKEDSHYQDWLKNWEKVKPPNGESYLDFTHRVSLFLNEVLHSIEKFHEDMNIIVVTHGGVIRKIMTYFLPSLSFDDTSIKNGQGVRMTLHQKGGGYICSSWSVAPILEKEISFEKGTKI
jgi:alpha-ribazole phosphatase